MMTSKSVGATCSGLRKAEWIKQFDQRMESMSIAIVWVC